jgi:hypothetical protein
MDSRPVFLRRRFLLPAGNMKAIRRETGGCFLFRERSRRLRALPWMISAGLSGSESVSVLHAEA